MDIGGTKCAVILGCLSETGEIDIIDNAVVPTVAGRTPTDTIHLLSDTADKLTKQNNVESQVTAIGISCGSPLDAKRGIILSPPNLTGWDHVPIIDILKERYRVPVALQIDANACVLAEWRFGAARGCDHVIFLTFGTGMGAGYILNGKLYSGASGMAGEVGHIRLSDFGPVGYGKAGSFEGFCSGGGIAMLAQMKVLEKLQAGETVGLCDGNSLYSLSAKAVAEVALQGDSLAVEIFQLCGKYLGKGLSILIDILNPEMIVIGSIFTRQKELLWDSAYKVIQKECLSWTKNSCAIVSAELGEEIGDYAAISVAAVEMDNGE